MHMHSLLGGRSLNQSIMVRCEVSYARETQRKGQVSLLHKLLYQVSTMRNAAEIRIGLYDDR